MQHDSRNISMLMDFYEMTMAHGYFTKQEKMEAFGQLLDILDELRVKCP